MNAEENLRRALRESMRMDPPPNNKEQPMSPPETPWGDMTTEEQAALHNLWHADVASQMAAFRDDMAAIKEDTSELRELMQAFKGAMKVLEMFGKLAKPLGYIAVLVGAVLALWPKK